jgi:hypothetical protein
MTIKQALTWMKKVFKDDILTESDGEFIKGYIRLIPPMNTACFVLLYNYYTDESRENSGTPTMIEKSYIYLPNLARRFCEVISSGNSDADNIKAMKESTLNANNGNNDTLVAYFNLCLDRIKYPNFVDIRMIFHELYKAISFDPDKGIDNREGALAEISKACHKFEKFVSEQEDMQESQGVEYVKEFFDGK